MNGVSVKTALIQSFEEERVVLVLPKYQHSLTDDILDRVIDLIGKPKRRCMNFVDYEEKTIVVHTAGYSGFHKESGAIIYINPNLIDYSLYYNFIKDDHQAFSKKDLIELFVIAEKDSLDAEPTLATLDNYYRPSFTKALDIDCKDIEPVFDPSFRPATEIVARVTVDLHKQNMNFYKNMFVYAFYREHCLDADAKDVLSKVGKAIQGETLFGETPSYHVLLTSLETAACFVNGLLDFESPDTQKNWLIQHSKSLTSLRNSIRAYEKQTTDGQDVGVLHKHDGQLLAIQLLIGESYREILRDKNDESADILASLRRFVMEGAYEAFLTDEICLTTYKHCEAIASKATDVEELLDASYQIEELLAID